MKLSSFAYFAAFGIRAILSGSHKPVLGTVILTDKCNLTCRHCSVNNITGVIYPYTQIKTEMQQLYEMGVRILFFCGGETSMWRDGEKTLRDLVKEAKAMGFFIVNVVTNGTFPIDLPEADLILLSLDGDREHHNIIRGDTYDTITKNVENATSDNICFYMAINRINKECIRSVCETATGLKNVRAVSFNFHTPYPDTTELALTREEKDKCCKTIAELKRNGAPIFNLTNAFKTDNAFAEFKAATKFETNDLLKRLRSMNSTRSKIGLGIATLVGVSTQPINMYLTKKKTGSDGFVGVEGREKDKTHTFKVLKTVMALIFGAGTLSTITTNPRKFASKLQFQGMMPTIIHII